MRFRVLGAVAVQAGEDWVSPRGALQRTLLATLLVHAGRPVSVDTLAEAMWGPQSPDPRVPARMQLHVHRLRTLLDDPDRLRNEQGRYRLVVDRAELDALEFEDLTARALEEDQSPEQVIDLVQEALALWQGTPYAGVPTPECEAEADRLDQRRLDLLEARFVAHVALDRQDQILAELTQLAQQHPMRERLQELLMVTLDRAGRRSDALQVYRDTHRALVEELGIDPGPRLRQVHERILAGEEELTDVASTPTPAQLPPAPPLLLGREPDLARLDLETVPFPGEENHRPDPVRPGVVVVTGMPGAGKTALVLRWAHEHAGDYPDGQLYCDLRGFSGEEPLDPHEVLAIFLTSLGARPGSMPTLQERQAMLRSLLARRRMLLVLDNAASTEQVRPLLPGAAGCLVLVTTRRDLTGLSARDGALQLTLDPLGLADSLNLLRRVAGEDAVIPEDVWVDLADACGHLPLALNIAAEQVRGRPESEVVEFVRGLSEDTHRLDSLEVDDDPRSDVRHVLSWSYRSLSAPAAAAFRAFGVLPGRTMDRHGAAALTGQDERQARRSLVELARAHLVEERGLGVYGQHDLLASYADELARDGSSEEEWTSARRALVAHYTAATVAIRDQLARDWEYPRAQLPDLPEAPPLADEEAITAWLAWQTPNALAALQEAPHEDDPLVVHACFVLGNELNRRDEFVEALTFYQMGSEAARRLGHIEDQATMELGLAWILYSSGDLDGAVPYLERGLGLAAEAGDTHGRAAALNNLGNVRADQGRYAEALEHLDESIAMIRQLGDELNTVVAQANAISIRVSMGDFDDALTEGQELLALVREQEMAVVEAALLGSLAKAHLGLGDAQRALHVGQQAREAAQQNGQRSRDARAVCVMGEATLALGDAAGAAGLFQEAFGVGRRLGDSRVVLEALQGWGRASADPAEARDLFSEALTLARRTGHRHDAETIEHLLSRGQGVGAGVQP